MTTPKTTFAGLALVAVLLIVGLITPALAEHEVETMDCSDPFADIPYLPGRHPPKYRRCKEGTSIPETSQTEPKPFKITCYQGGEKIISLNPVFNARQSKTWVGYERADGTTGRIVKGADTTCNVEPVEPNFWEGWKIWEGWGNKYFYAIKNQRRDRLKHKKKSVKKLVK